MSDCRVRAHVVNISDMKILMIGWGRYVQNNEFTIHCHGDPKISEIGPEIRSRVQNRMAKETFQYIYEKIRIFKEGENEQGDVVEITCDDDLKGVKTLMIMPGTHRYDSYPEFGNYTVSRLMFRGSRERFSSLARLCGITTKYKRDQSKLITTIFDLGTIGFFGRDREDDVRGNEITVQCVHCFKETRILKTLSAEQAQMIHVAESPGCIVGRPEIARKICDEKERLENYYANQLAITMQSMIQQRDRADFYARKRYDERQSLFVNARHPRMAEKDEEENFRCAICCVKTATVISIPCYHLSSCKSCFIHMKAINDGSNSSRSQEEPKNELRCPICNTESILFTIVYGGSGI